MEYTKNYELRKPEINEYYDVEDFNENVDVIDEALGGLKEESHKHSNKSILDKITETLITNWNNAVSHITDSIKHITADERNLWNSVSGKADSGHTHDDRYYTESEIDNKFSGYSPTNHSHNYILTSASCNKNWNWNGQGGQPQWLWGSNDGTNMYVYNPSNFSVNYANTGHALRTYAAGGASHGTDWLLNCQHNLDGDNLFKIYVGNKSIGVKVDKASVANSVDWGGVQNKPNSYTPASHNQAATTISVADTAGYFSGTNVETVLAEIWKALKYPSQAIQGAVDWNNYMVTGVYKIQNCTMTSTYHAPSAYSYGILIVIHPEQGGENRCLQIYVPHNSEGMYFARMYNTTWNGWKSSINHTHSYLPLSGGTVTGQIKKAGTSSSWHTGRDNAMIRQTSLNGYSPLFSTKTANGSWELGGYVDNILHLSYIKDTDYTLGNNTQTANFQFKADGSFTGAKVYNAIWGADYAEAFEFEGEQPQVGEIVEISENKKLQKSSENSRKVVGVVSSTYCILAGSDLEEVQKGNRIAVGLLGQLPIKIIGKVETGDFIMSVGNGIGKVADENVPRGSIIGRALESNSEKNIKMVYCLIQPQ